MIIYLIVLLIKNTYLYKVSYFPGPYNHRKIKIEVNTDLSNYATKSHLRNATGADMSDFDKKADLANLKSVVDKLDINNLAELDADVWNLFLLVKKK